MSAWSACTATTKGASPASLTAFVLAQAWSKPRAVVVARGCSVPNRGSQYCPSVARSDGTGVWHSGQHRSRRSFKQAAGTGPPRYTVRRRVERERGALRRRSRWWPPPSRQGRSTPMVSGKPGFEMADFTPNGYGATSALVIEVVLTLFLPAGGPRLHQLPGAGKLRAHRLTTRNTASPAGPTVYPLRTAAARPAVAARSGAAARPRSARARRRRSALPPAGRAAPCCRCRCPAGGARR